ncbi:Acyl-CoA dehydrogenase, probable dibenzothiophene desulfurization enzyme [Pseudonocardia sp. Ae406_Ps2]|uniref:hypothetical protein n=1 Tax=unclassified Pseudonocardia TaxID=2619320 RepID=UPI00094ACC69|nr:MULTISPECIES: hypothetical protein [unclassified Pseudonocardia]OLM00571.1 Acyl-CoA dehydrogenase, probable dibenzothiophene desulfurization enzyme [Pseudonocardia sp. Ae406_Ps2]OLM07638.1 Acyl-CoA dehydrogenase, probable dibenzothiophene desulfurization enzyme [Pseudonocardia sp. Ae331_Ps2]OLM22144.1 Acyl-CoA dehydrogenase, probable dibenzothiophene desulfurization enzyme [Pseudonocardia sp. Ae706_Ps2]OLM31214.1 Acyl-CoA dehydrogenase, probable dibenzothiophene desulfurization enzyme [Pseud
MPDTADDAAWWEEVARSFAEDLPDTDGAARRRHAVAALADNGLTTLLGPARHGGAEQPWRVAHRVVREIARVDPTIAELLGRHYVWYWIAEFIGTDEKIDHIGEVSTRSRWFYCGASDPCAAELTVVDDGEAMLFDGRIAPAVGADVSTITILQGARSDVATPISALAYTSHPGISVPGHDGARIEVSGADIPWTGALGHVDKRFEPRPYNGLLAPTLDLVLLDIALAARTTYGTTAATAAAIRRADEAVEQAQRLHDRRRSVTDAEVRAQAVQVSELTVAVGALPGPAGVRSGGPR